MAGPHSVLFVCNLNRVRSPMAEALARRIGGTRLHTDSCGLVGTDEIDGFAAAVMAELGADLTEHRPKTFDAVKDQPFELIVSLTPEAHRRVEEAVRGRGIGTEFWPIADPTLETGARDRRLEAYRAVRDELKRRIAERFSQPRP